MRQSPFVSVPTFPHPDGSLENEANFRYLAQQLFSDIVERVLDEIQTTWDAGKPATSRLSSSSATTISSTSTFVKAAGTTTEVKSSDAWTHSSNRWTYSGPDAIITARVMVSMSCAGAQDNVDLRLAKNASPTATEAVATNVKRKVGAVGDVGAAAIEGVFSVSEGDYVELWVANEDSTANITVDHMHFLVQTEHY